MIQEPSIAAIGTIKIPHLRQVGDGGGNRRGVGLAEFETPCDGGGRFPIVTTVSFLIVDRQERISAVRSAHVHLQSS